MNHGWEGTWEVSGRGLFEIRSRNLPGEIRRNHEKKLILYMPYTSRDIEPSTSQIQVWTLTSRSDRLVYNREDPQLG
jgi:hypothetical protein